jgi:hypothetical protein
MKEIFKDIPEYEGFYQVSNLGNVKSLERIAIRLKKGNYIVKEKILKHIKCANGYYDVVLCKNKQRKMIKVHQLVAMAFLNHKPNRHKIVVDHIDNNPLNNRLENLQLISARENTSKDRKNGSSQYIGVSWIKRYNKWKAEIRINGKQKYLGRFANELKASEAYQNALKNL